MDGAGLEKAVLTREVFKQPISYRFDLWRPAADAHGPLLVCLHGYGQNKEMALRFGQNIRRDWPLAALQAPHPHHVRTHSRTRVQNRDGVPKDRDSKDRDSRNGGDGFGAGFSWVSSFEPGEDVANHHHFVAHVIARAYAAGITDRPAAFLFGFSQSVSLNYRFALAHPESVRGVIAVAGATPSSWQGTTPRLRVPVLHVAPTEDEAYSSAKAAGFRARLEACTDDLTWLEPPGGHRAPSACYPAIRAWLQDRC